MQRGPARGRYLPSGFDTSGRPSRSGSEVDRCVIKERRCLGQGVDKVAKIAEVLNYLRQGCRLTGAGTACEGDAGDIFIHL